LGLGDVERGGRGQAKLQLVKGKEVRSSCIQFDDRHVLYAKLRPYLNKVVIPQTEGVGSTEFVPLVPDSSIITRRFLGWYLRSPQFVDYAVRNSTGSRMPRVRMSALWQADIPLPPLDEQRRIVARIEELSAHIEEARRLRDVAGEESERLMSAAMRDVFAPSGDELPYNWEWKTVEDVGDRERDAVQTGPFGAQLKSSEFVETGVPVLAIGNVQWGYLDTSELKYVTPQKAEQLSRYRVRPGDILFTRMGTVGRSCVVPTEANDWLISYHLLRVSVDKNRCNPKYLNYCFRGAPQIEAQIEQRSRGATRSGVNTKILASLRFPAAPLSAQHSIIEYLDGVQSQVTSLKQAQEAAMVSPARLFEGRLARLNGLNRERKEALAGLSMG